MQFLKDPSFEAQYRRTLGYASLGGAELSECFYILNDMKPVNYENWYKSWRNLSDKLNASADSMSIKYPVSAGENYLRASNYYRTAYFFLEENPEDLRIADCLRMSKGTFSRFLELQNVQTVALKIPFETTFLPGYLYLSPGSELH